MKNAVLMIDLLELSMQKYSSMVDGFTSSMLLPWTIQGSLWRFEMRINTFIILTINVFTFSNTLKKISDHCRFTWWNIFCNSDVEVFRKDNPVIKMMLQVLLAIFYKNMDCIDVGNNLFYAEFVQGSFVTGKAPFYNVVEATKTL